MEGVAMAGGEVFLQEEDGIRDTSVTGVQTCALPIWSVRTLPYGGKQTAFVGEHPMSSSRVRCLFGARPGNKAEDSTPAHFRIPTATWTGLGVAPSWAGRWR